MCVKCVGEAFPDRERTVLEAGHYVANFSGCWACKAARSEGLAVSNRRAEEEEESDGEFEETVEFDHACARCGHVVAGHYYCFRVRQELGQQEYSMSCALCGKGEDAQRTVPSARLPAEEEPDRKPASKAVEEPPTAPFASLMSGMTIAAAPKSQADASDDADWE